MEKYEVDNIDSINSSKESSSSSNVDIDNLGSFASAGLIEKDCQRRHSARTIVEFTYFLDICQVPITSYDNIKLRKSSSSQGTFMDVLLGELKASDEPPGFPAQLVAVKQSKALAEALTKPPLTDETLANYNSSLTQLLFEIKIMSHSTIAKHRNIVNIHSVSIAEPCFITDDGLSIFSPVLLMELADMSLASFYSNTSPNDTKCSYSVKASLLADIADGLEVLHMHSIVHWDLKPSNILIFTGSNGEVIAKLCDFGGSEVAISHDKRTNYSLPWLPPKTDKDVNQPNINALGDNYTFGLLIVWVSLNGSDDPFFKATDGTYNDLKAQDKATAYLDELMVDFYSSYGNWDEYSRFKNLVAKTLICNPRHRLSSLDKVRETLLQRMQPSTTNVSIVPFTPLNRRWRPNHLNETEEQLPIIFRTNALDVTYQPFTTVAANLGETARECLVAETKTLIDEIANASSLSGQAELVGTLMRVVSSIHIRDHIPTHYRISISKSFDKCFSSLLSPQDIADNFPLNDFEKIEDEEGNEEPTIFRQIREGTYSIPTAGRLIESEIVFRGWQRLHYASHFGRIDLIEHFLSQGDNPDVVHPRFNISPLHLASFKADLKAAKILIESKANLSLEANLDLGKKYFSDQPRLANCLEFAIGGNMNNDERLKLIRYLSEIGLDLRFRRESGESLFWLCIGDLEKTKLIYELAPDIVHYTTAYSQSILHAIVKAADIRSLEFFCRLKTLDINARDSTGLTPLHLAFRALRRWDIWKKIYHNHDPYLHFLPSHYGPSKVNESIVGLLVQYGASLDIAANSNLPWTTPQSELHMYVRLYNVNISTPAKILRDNPNFSQQRENKPWFSPSVGNYVYLRPSFGNSMIFTQTKNVIYPGWYRLSFQIGRRACLHNDFELWVNTCVMDPPNGVFDNRYLLHPDLNLAHWKSENPLFQKDSRFEGISRAQLSSICPKENVQYVVERGTFYNKRKGISVVTFSTPPPTARDAYAGLFIGNILTQRIEWEEPGLLGPSEVEVEFSREVRNELDRPPERLGFTKRTIAKDFGKLLLGKSKVTVVGPKDDKPL